MLNEPHRKDPSKPKRAMSAFFLYSQAFRPTIKAENPDAAFGDIVSGFLIFDCFDNSYLYKNKMMIV